MPSTKSQLLDSATQYERLNADLVRDGLPPLRGKVLSATHHGLVIQFREPVNIAIGAVTGVDLYEGEPSDTPDHQSIGKVTEVLFSHDKSTVRLALKRGSDEKHEDYIQLVERRGGLRYGVPVSFPCGVKIALPEGGRSIPARLLDVSGNSIGLTVDVLDEPTLSDHVGVRVSLALPGGAPPRSIECVIRRRSVNGSGVDIGMQLDGTDPDALESASELLCELIGLVKFARS